MWPSVQSAFAPYNSKLEGKDIPYMYLDVGDLKNPGVSGKVTTAMGNLIDDGFKMAVDDTGTGWGPALGLGWVNTDGSLADQQTIIAQWKAVKARQDLRKAGGGPTGPFPALTTIRLPPSALASLIDRQFQSNERFLKGRFPSWDSWPADAQFATHNMAWAMGAAFNFPKFDAAANQTPPNFTTMAAESHCGNCVPARNVANVRLFQNAAAVVAGGYDPSVLYYPGTPGGVPAPPAPSGPAIASAFVQPSAAAAFAAYASVAVMNTLATQLVSQLPGFITFPADAQLALLTWSLANARSTSAGFTIDWTGWPKFVTALSQTPPDFTAAGTQAHWQNEPDQQAADIAGMFANAAVSQANGDDPAVLVWTPASTANMSSILPSGDVASFPSSDGTGLPAGFGGESGNAAEPDPSGTTKAVAFGLGLAILLAALTRK
jgi:hypothetical protein